MDEPAIKIPHEFFPISKADLDMLRAEQVSTDRLMLLQKVERTNELLEVIIELLQNIHEKQRRA